MVYESSGKIQTTVTTAFYDSNERSVKISLKVRFSMALMKRAGISNSIQCLWSLPDLGYIGCANEPDLIVRSNCSFNVSL